MAAAAVGGPRGVTAFRDGDASPVALDEAVKAQFVKLCTGKITGTPTREYGTSRVFRFIPEGTTTCYVVKLLDNEHTHEADLARRVGDLAIGPRVFFTHVSKSAVMTRGIIVMQHYPKDLFWMCAAKKPVSFVERVGLVHRAAYQVLRLHTELGMPHLDLKRENIVCEEDGSDLRLIDFQERVPGSSKVQYTIGYASPQRLERIMGLSAERCVTPWAPSDPMSEDVYSLGVLLLETASISCFKPTFVDSRRKLSTREAAAETYAVTHRDANLPGIINAMFSRTGVSEAHKEAVARVACSALRVDPVKRVSVSGFVDLLDGLLKEIH